MKKLKNKSIVISAASLIISGFASAEVAPEARVGEVPGAENRTPTMDSDNMTVPGPYMPETVENPYSWDYGLSDEGDASLNNRAFIAGERNTQEQMSIRAAQQMLVDLGYTIRVDGVAGRETKSALRDFQAANGIAQTARLDASTVAALRDSTSMDPDRFPASFEDEELPYDSAFPPLPGDGSSPSNGDTPQRPGGLQR
jgi:hypothetical protein